MLRTKTIDDGLRHARLNAKTRDQLFRRRIEQGANCAPFVSQAILETVKEVFPFDPDDALSQLELGRIKLLVVAAHEPPGKSVADCQKVPVVLTLDAARDDFELRCQQGVTALRRARILRMAVEAREQGGLLSHEDLAYRLLNCGLRTIVRDVQHLRSRDLVVPTRGQQQDMGPGQTHRVQAVTLFLQGLEPREIARRIYHSLSSIENYVSTFARVVLLAQRRYGNDEIAFILRRSTALVAAYRQLYRDAQRQPAWKPRLREILERVQNPVSPRKKGASRKGGAR